MRRRRLLAAALVAGTFGALAPAARADDWSGGMEAGAEADSNVRRVETGPDTTEQPVAAGLFRLGGRGAGRGTTRYGTWSIDGLGLLRAVAAPTDTGESIAVVAGDARWDVPIPERSARVFVRGDVYDVLDLEGQLSTRAFASEGLDLGLVAFDGDRRVTVSAGARDFTYKPDHDFDWRGPSLGVRFDAPLWRVDGDEPRSLDLAADYRLERRSFTGLAYADGCMVGAAPDPSCYLPTPSRRVDLHHRALAQVTYTGERVLSLGYELAVTDSTSYGQSVVQHRALASFTTEVGAKVLATASAILELDQYPAPLLVARDTTGTTFSSIEDDNRNMIALLLGRPIAKSWSVEARYAYWANAFSSDAYSFRRQLVYVGIVWGAPR